jgi:hypothetical protein
MVSLTTLLLFYLLCALIFFLGKIGVIQRQQRKKHQFNTGLIVTLFENGINKLNNFVFSSAVTGAKLNKFEVS